MQDLAFLFAQQWHTKNKFCPMSFGTGISLQASRKWKFSLKFRSLNKIIAKLIIAKK